MRAIADRAAERKQREREAGVYNSSQAERHRESQGDRRALHPDRDASSRGRDGDRGDFSRRDPSRFVTNALVPLIQLARSQASSVGGPPRQISNLLPVLAVKRPPICKRLRWIGGRTGALWRLPTHLDRLEKAQAMHARGC